MQAGSSRTRFAARCAAATSSFKRAWSAATSAAFRGVNSCMKVRQASVANSNPGPSVGHVPSDKFLCLYDFCILPLPGRQPDVLRVGTDLVDVSPSSSSGDGTFGCGWLWHTSLIVVERSDVFLSQKRSARVAATASQKP